mmetsp:Transcript_4922/g.11152  ORF Transcript_4922/g.11152 Transcript_4922/m.11152 type:complete len:261 (+) Transcript_4922:1288-2070(+)
MLQRRLLPCWSRELEDLPPRLEPPGVDRQQEVHGGVARKVHPALRQLDVLVHDARSIALLPQGSRAVHRVCRPPVGLVVGHAHWADPSRLRLVGWRLVGLQSVVYVLLGQQQEPVQGLHVDPPPLAPTHDLSSVLLILGERVHQLLVADCPILAANVEVSRGVQLLDEGQLGFKDALEELGQRILNRDPRVPPLLLLLVRPAHVEPVGTHLAEEVPRAPLQVRERLVLRQVPVVAHERVADALHGDPDLVGNTRQDVDVH